MRAWREVSRELRRYDSAVLSARDREGYPVTIRCRPAPDEDRAAFAVRVPDGLGVDAGPAWLLCHFHDRQFWGLRSFGARGQLERADGGWLFRPAAFVPGMGGILAMVRMFVGGRRRAYRYLAMRHLEPPDVRWDLVNEAKARAKEHLRVAGSTRHEDPRRVSVKDAKFVGSIEATSGEALGLFITNQDAFEHAFDIDALNIHVRLPAKGTAAVVVKSNKAGALEYYCGVPGRKGAGMVGELTVR